MIGAGTVINPLLKVITTVVILAAVYYFVIRPILETTEEAIDQGARVAREAEAEARERAAQVSANVAKSRLDSMVLSLQGASWREAVRAVRDCRRDAGNDARALEKCVKFAQRITTAVRSNRTFALSYADSLASQGRGADADRVRDCVDGAGFAVAAMQRCRDLADELLFNR
ncbi:MAG TPA: hypothetical protein VIL04_13495 [Solirubrobacterales bacterium]